MLTYVSAAIDKAQDDDWGWLPNLQEQITRLAWPDGDAPTLYVPARAFSVVAGQHLARTTAIDLINVNQFVMQQIDALILHYSPGVESWGCPMELYLANQRSLPVYLHVDSEESLGSLGTYLQALTDPEHRFASWLDLALSMRSDMEHSSSDDGKMGGLGALMRLFGSAPGLGGHMGMDHSAPRPAASKAKKQ